MNNIKSSIKASVTFSEKDPCFYLTIYVENEIYSIKYTTTLGDTYVYHFESLNELKSFITYNPNLFCIPEETLKAIYRLRDERKYVDTLVYEVEPLSVEPPSIEPIQTAF